MTERSTGTVGPSTPDVGTAMTLNTVTLTVDREPGGTSR
jgi:hypothetical protein